MRYTSRGIGKSPARVARIAQRRPIVRVYDSKILGMGYLYLILAQDGTVS